MNDTHEKPAKLEAETSHQISTAEDGPYMMADLGNNVGSINSKSHDQSLHPPCTYEMVGSLQPVQLSSAINKLPTTQEVRHTYVHMYIKSKVILKLLLRIINFMR